MNHWRRTAVVHGVGSLLATLALIVGVPVLLATRVGWPLPTSIPNLDALEQAARTGISDQVVVKILAVVAWLAWSQLAVAFIFEAVAVAQRRQATHIPMLPGLQVVAGRLVAGILMVATTVQPARADAARPPAPLVVQTAAFTASTADPSVPSLTGATPTHIARTTPATTPISAVDHPTVTVQRHDSYWAIAERTLGDGLRWREILDLNAGRTLPDGTIITAGDDTLRTGSRLLLPADATGDLSIVELTAETLTPAAVDQHLSTVVVERGDNLWTISEDRLEVDLGREPADAEVAPFWRAVIDANQDRFVQPGNPNLIFPGQVLVLPPTGLGPPAAAAVDQATAPPAVPTPVPKGKTPGQPVGLPVTSTALPAPAVSKPTPPSSERQPSAPSHPHRAEGDDAANGVTSPLGVALGGLSSIALAVGLKRLLDRRRRRYANHDGQPAGRTPPDQRDLHHAVVAQADEASVDDLQGALGQLAASLAQMSSTRRPRIVRHGSASLEVLLDHPGPNAPSGWTSTDDGTIWTLTATPDLDDSDDGPLNAAPLMVTIGQPDEDAQLYLDLETDGLLALTGDPIVATNLARSMVTELAIGPLAETLRVIAIGDVVDPEAEVLEYLTLAGSWDEVLEDVRAWAIESHDALAENDWPNPFVARGHEPDHDALVPLAIIADRPPPAELTESLRASLPSAVAVVVVGAFDGCVASVRCEADALNCDDIELACAPQEVEVDELAKMCRFLAAADRPDERLLIDERRAEPDAAVSSNGSGPGPEPDDIADDRHLAPDHSEPPGYDVLVRLLGEITVEGGTALKAKATAVVAYLALHRSVTTERLEDACWFGSDGMSHRKRLRDVMTESRAALGSQHLPANRGGSYTAGPRVSTDLDLFDWHVGRAAQLEPPAAVEHYRAALDLVTGRPFTYPNAARSSYGWVDFEHHSTEWEYRVARIAQACAEMHLDTDEAGEAIEMLRRVVRAIPLNSAVVETLMRAHMANGDRAGAERVYQEHAIALEQGRLGDPDDAIERVRLEIEAC